MKDYVPQAEPIVEVTPDEAVQIELEGYRPSEDRMSPGLVARLVSETDPDRLTDAMREGHDQASLWVAWLRS